MGVDFETSLNIPEQLAPATPSSGLELYAKTDKKLYTKDTLGVETDISTAGSGGGGISGSGVTDVQVFLAGTGTWTKPLNAVLVEVQCLAGGGAGGSGRKGVAGGVRNGGSAGGSGGYSMATFKGSDLPATVAVSVGTTAVGGATQTLNSTNGLAGGIGANVRFGPSDADCYVRATGGGAGQGGIATTDSTPAAGNGVFVGATGRAPANGTQLAGIAGVMTAGGGTGGGISAANAVAAGGAGAVPNSTIGRTNPVAGVTDGGTGASGTNPSSATQSIIGGSSGAGGGARATAGTAGAGGAGGLGAGGGGGGAALDTTSTGSGAGGNGGPGVVIVMSSFALSTDTIATKTAAYTLVDTDDVILADATSAAFTLTLPAASTRSRPYLIKRINAGLNNVTIDANASETIDGDLTAVLTAQYSFVTLISNGTNWSVF